MQIDVTDWVLGIQREQSDEVRVRMRNLVAPPFDRLLLGLSPFPARVRTEQRVSLPSGKRLGICRGQSTKSKVHLAIMCRARKPDPQRDIPGRLLRPGRVLSWRPITSWRTSSYNGPQSRRSDNAGCGGIRLVSCACSSLRSFLVSAVRGVSAKCDRVAELQRTAAYPLIAALSLY